MTLNTYGLFAINQKTFNMFYQDEIFYPRRNRDIVITALRIHNGAFNIMGYIPGISFCSGMTRMVTGFSITVVTLIIGHPDNSPGPIIGRWYSEALETGVAQVARGILEAIQFGWRINAALDVIGTVVNIGSFIRQSLVCECCAKGGNPQAIVPHKDVNYRSSLLKILYLV